MMCARKEKKANVCLFFRFVDFRFGSSSVGHVRIFYERMNRVHYDRSYTSFEESEKAKQEKSKNETNLLWLL